MATQSRNNRTNNGKGGVVLGLEITGLVLVVIIGFMLSVTVGFLLAGCSVTGWLVGRYCCQVWGSSDHNR